MDSLSDTARPKRLPIKGDAGIREAYALLGTLSLALRPASSEDMADMTERATAIRRVIRILGRYGIAGDTAFRYGFAHENALPVLRSIITPGHEGSLPEQLAVRWQRTLDIDAAPGALDTWIGRFLTWFHDAPMEQVLKLWAPDREQWNRFPPFSPIEVGVADPYIWLRDRYLFPHRPDAWSTTSLHHEYRYLESGDLNGFPERAILPSTLEQNALNAQIAKRAAHSKQDEARRLYENIYRYVIPLLERKEGDHAAELFEFHLAQHPHDRQARIALAFCLIPFNPEKAEWQLSDMLNTGGRQDPLVVYDLCSCLILQGNHRRALQIARHYWSEQRGHAPRRRASAHLWDVTGGGAVLMETDDVDACLAAMCARASERCRQEEDAAFWRGALKEPSTHRPTDE